MSYRGTSWLDKIYKKRDLEIKKLNIEIGDWINLDSEYGDVWHEVKQVFSPDDYYGSVVLYRQVDSKSEEVKTEMTYFFRIRKVCKSLPDDARCIFCEQGSFSDRRGNLSKLKV